MAGGLAALEPLVGLLTPTELRRVADSLDIDRRPRRAAREASEVNRGAAAELLVPLAEEFGALSALAATLRAFAVTIEDRPSPPVVVWSGPLLPGDSHRTTDAIVRLIDQAEESVLASTYSGSTSAPFVKALRRAADRKLTITLIVDIARMLETAELLKKEVPRATMLGYHYGSGASAGLQHSKVVVVDGQSSLVTSANLSVAAIEKNLEAGILIEDPTIASQITRRFADLTAAGFVQLLA